MVARRGVFCFEGQWNELHERDSVLPTLELLERLESIRYVHRDVVTREELSYYLQRWTQAKYDNYKVGVFAMHGDRCTLHLSDRHWVDLDDLASELANLCTGRRFYFASCSVLNASDDVLRSFLEETGAELVCGYTVTVTGWSPLRSRASCSTVSPTAGSTRSKSRMRTARWEPLAAHLGFKVVYRDRDPWIPRAERAAAPRQRSGARV